MQLHVWHFAKLPDCFPKHLYRFPFLPATYENPKMLLTRSPTLASLSILNTGGSGDKSASFYPSLFQRYSYARQQALQTLIAQEAYLGPWVQPE